MGVRLRARLRVGVQLTVELSDAERPALRLWEGVPLGLTERVALGEAVPVRVGVAVDERVGEGEEDGLRDRRDRERVQVREALRLTDRLRLAAWLGLRVAVGGEGVCVPVRDAEAVPGAEAEHVAERVAV